MITSGDCSTKKTNKQTKKTQKNLFMTNLQMTTGNNKGKIQTHQQKKEKYTFEGTTRTLWDEIQHLYNNGASQTTLLDIKTATHILICW